MAGNTQLPVIIFLYALIFCQCGRYAAALTSTPKILQNFTLILKNKLNFANLFQEISCLSCHLDSYPFYGCLDKDDVTLEQIAAGTDEGSNLYFRGMDVVDKCDTCGIEDTWHRSSGKFLYRRKLCFVANVTSSSGCTYEYPVGSEEVKEVCYCNTNLCNLKDIASLGGSHDFKKFPTMKPYHEEVSMATRGIPGGEGIGMLIFLITLNYFCAYWKF